MSLDLNGRRPSTEVESESAASKVEARVDSTVELLVRAQSGDQKALDLIFERYVPSLKRWASGRLPIKARGMLDTDDLVQDTVLGMLRHVPDFEHRHEGALHSYLRRALMNRIRDEIRRFEHRPSETTAGEQLVEEDDSPLAQLIGKEVVEEYEQALEQLRPADRELVLARIELGLSYEQIACTFGKTSPDAARMAVARALMKLAGEMAR